MVNNIYEIPFEVTRDEYADFLIRKMLERYFVNNSKRERDRRALLTRFRQFRDKCNVEWKPDDDDYKYCIVFYTERNALEVDWYCSLNVFELFGGFKDERACKRAIELFGDEIKRLWVEEIK